MKTITILITFFHAAMAPIGGVAVSGNNDSQNKHSNSSSKNSSRSGSSAPGGGDSNAANGVNGAKDADNNRLWAKLLTEGTRLTLRQILCLVE